jgi:hypothetical protein
MLNFRLFQHNRSTPAGRDDPSTARERRHAFQSDLAHLEAWAVGSWPNHWRRKREPPRRVCRRSQTAKRAEGAEWRRQVRRPPLSVRSRSMSSSAAQRKREALRRAFRAAQTAKSAGMGGVISPSENAASERP